MANAQKREEKQATRPAKRTLQTTVVYIQKTQPSMSIQDINSKSCVSTPKRLGKKQYLNDGKSVEKGKTKGNIHNGKLTFDKGMVKYANDSQFQIAEMAAQTIDHKQHEFYEKRSDSLFQREGTLNNYITLQAKENTTFMKYQRALNQAGAGGKHMLSFGTDSQRD